MPADLPRPVVVSAVPTPFASGGELDLASARRLFGSLVDAGIDALFVAGTTGEFPALEAGERLRLFELALEVAGPQRVIAHVGAASAHQAVALARDAVAAGATRLAAITPYYLPAGPDAVLRYYAAVSAGAPGVDVYAYLYPRVTGTDLDAQDTARIVREADLRGVKLTGIGMGFVAELAGLVPAGVDILSGNDAMAASVVRVGGHGVVSAVSATAPWAFLALAAGVPTGADVPWQPRVDALVAAMGRISVQKAVLADSGAIATDTCRMALDPPTPAERRAAVAAVAASRQPSS